MICGLSYGEALEIPAHLANVLLDEHVRLKREAKMVKD